MPGTPGGSKGVARRSSARPGRDVARRRGRKWDRARPERARRHTRGARRPSRVGASRRGAAGRRIGRALTPRRWRLPCSR